MRRKFPDVSQMNEDLDLFQMIVIGCHLIGWISGVLLTSWWAGLRVSVNGTVFEDADRCPIRMSPRVAV